MEFRTYNTYYNNLFITNVNQVFGMLLINRDAYASVTPFIIHIHIHIHIHRV